MRDNPSSLACRSGRGRGEGTRTARIATSVTTRFRWLVEVPEDLAASIALAFLALSAVLGVAGGTWDAAWHVTLRRETFWSPPHLLLYGGTTLALGAAILGVASAWLRGESVWRAAPGFALAAIGAAVVIGAAPLDDFWHRTFGRDVDVWSFPHLVALVGGAGINIGGALACRQRLVHEREQRRVAVYAVMVLFGMALLWVSMFGLNWYTLVLARVRDSLEYPVLASLVAVPGLVLARELLGRGGATLVSGVYMVYVIGAHALLATLGYALLPFPPFVLAPAILVDIIMSGSSSSVLRGAAAGVAFVPVFLAAEAASLAWYPHPALPPPRSEAMQGYLNALAGHPWDPEHIVAGLPLILLAGALGGGLGTLVLRGLRRALAEAKRI